MNLEIIFGHILFRLLHFILFGGFKASKVLGYVWGSIPASSTNSFNFQQIPMFIGFTATTVPTSIQIEVNGEGMVMNLDGAGITALTHIREQNRITNTYVFMLGNGLINGKNGTVTIANAQAAVLNVLGWSPILKGNTYNVHGRVAVLANQALTLKKFAYASFPSMGATDRVSITYNDGSTDNVGRDEIASMLGYTQGYLPAAPYNVDNISPARIDNLQFIGAAQTAYLVKYAGAYGGNTSLEFV